MGAKAEVVMEGAHVLLAAVRDKQVMFQHPIIITILFITTLINAGSFPHGSF